MNLGELKASVRLPVIAAPMFLVSGVELVVAACRAGIVGSFPALNARSPDILEHWLAEIEQRLGDGARSGERPAPYAVNVVLRSTWVAEQVAALQRVRAQVVITSVGDPAEVTKHVHDWGGLVFHDATNVRYAEKAAQAGVDGIIAVCSGAGGHAGSLSAFDLVPQVRESFGGAVIVAGAIGDGRGILAAQAMGGDFAYMGTRFIATPESLAPAAYKEMLLGAEAADVLYTDAISGLPANFLRQSLREVGLDPDALPPRRAPLEPNLPRGLKAWKDIWSAGHAVGMIKEIQPVETIVRRLESEYREARIALAAR